MTRDTRPTFAARLDLMPAVVREVADHRLVLTTDDPVALRDWAAGLVRDCDRYIADRRGPVPGQIEAF